MLAHDFGRLLQQYGWQAGAAGRRDERLKIA
jgi:hypothetical protein